MININNELRSLEMTGRLLTLLTPQEQVSIYNRYLGSRLSKEISDKETMVTKLLQEIDELKAKIIK